MKNQAAARDSAAQGFGVAQVATYDLHIEFANITAGTCERPHRNTTFAEKPRHVPADKTRRSCN